MKLRVARRATADLDEIWAYVAKSQSIEAAERLINIITRRFHCSLRTPASAATAQSFPRVSVASPLGTIASTTARREVALCEYCPFDTLLGTKNGRGRGGRYTPSSSGALDMVAAPLDI
jgi:plasmid stabilization system protein ParE